MAIARTVIKISFHLSKFFHIKIASPKKMTIKMPLARRASELLFNGIKKGSHIRL